MEEGTYTLILKRLYCYFVEERGHDDVYLMYNGRKLWPEDKRQQPIAMDTVTELNVGVNGLLDQQIVHIELWDWDFFSSDDLLGVFAMQISPGGPYTTDMEINKKETDKAKYTLEWEVRSNS
jgi:hypothetical protein